MVLDGVVLDGVVNISVICEPVSEAVVLDGSFQSFVNQFQRQMDNCEHFSHL